MTSIMLSGAERSGKSTLAAAIADKTGWDFIPSRASSVFRAMGLPVGPLPAETRMEVQERILDSFVEDLDGRTGKWISDRSPLDMAAYTMLDLAGTDFDQDRFGRYIERCLYVANTRASLIALIQPGIPYVEAEGKPRRCPIRQEVMNSLITAMMHNWMLTPTLWRMMRSTIDLEERIEAILGVNSWLIAGAAEKIRQDGVTLH